jgi:NAD(P)-dependent dehydrogenase (short-subunit alcohol dehydrogenase family)
MKQFCAAQPAALDRLCHEGADGALVAIFDRQGLGHARWGTAEEADVIVLLLSRATRFVNGAVLRIDGGQWPAIGY